MAIAETALGRKCSAKDAVLRCRMGRGEKRGRQKPVSPADFVSFFFSGDAIHQIHPGHRRRLRRQRRLLLDLQAHVHPAYVL